jgi:selenocysteine lyase/cysteine desulfurase
VRAHEEALLARALDGLRVLPGVTLHGDATDRAPTLMFSVVHYNDEEDADRLVAAVAALTAEAPTSGRPRWAAGSRASD